MSISSAGTTNWVLSGWTALHQAALDVGAGIDYDPREFPELRSRDVADTRQYVALVEPLTQFLEMELEIPTIRAEPVRILVWRKLRTLGRKNCPGLWHLLTNPAQRVDPAQEYQRMQARQQGDWATTKPLPPVLAARHGYRLLWQDGHSYLDPVSRLLWGLALIGWSARHWHEVAICELCFRFTYPGARFCDEHSQHGRSGVARSQAYQRYRLGKKAYALAAQRGQLDFLRGNAIVRDTRRRLALSDVIFEWDYESDAIDDEMELLQASLAASPRVLKKIGTAALDSDFETLTEILREQLDPYRWDPMLWGWAVLQAEMWFALEEELSPGKRGYGQATLERIARAKALAKSGLNSRQIARELGISPSTISKWIARGRFST
jgi:transposase-like protein